MSTGFSSLMALFSTSCPGRRFPARSFLWTLPAWSGPAARAFYRLPSAGRSARLAAMPSQATADLERHLNPGRIAAVVHGEGPQLVLAGAGSGKTRLITYRISWLVEQ